MILNHIFSVQNHLYDYSSRNFLFNRQICEVIHNVVTRSHNQAGIFESARPISGGFLDLLAVALCGDAALHLAAELRDSEIKPGASHTYPCISPRVRLYVTRASGHVGSLAAALPAGRRSPCKLSACAQPVDLFAIGRPKGKVAALHGGQAR